MVQKEDCVQKCLQNRNYHDFTKYFVFRVANLSQLSDSHPVIKPVSSKEKSIQTHQPKLTIAVDTPW